jgi:peptidoglycan/xylan/chitin deacetylase (PgdA/CDA1 family)
MTTIAPLASVSLDLDNVWTYLRTHGDPGWERRPSYLSTFIPYVLDVLEEAALSITFFVVGSDAEHDENKAALRSLTQSGHDIGNHSFEHEPWLTQYDHARLCAEIERAESAISAATGRRPVGFRGPGYVWSPDLLSILGDRGYLYDASTLPTYLGPLARAYYFRTAKLSAAERERRAQLFGRFSEGFRPVRPYYWALPNGKSLLELPVTTFPGIKVPFHLSYLLYVSRFSEPAMIAYLRAALAACRLSGIEPSFLLHPLDFIDGTQEPRLSFFPGMDVPAKRKVALFGRAIALFREHFALVSTGTHARSLIARANLRVRQPVAAAAAESTSR